MARSGSRLSFRTLVLIGFEAGLILAAILLAVWLRLGRGAVDIMLEEQGVWKALLIAASCQFCLYYADLYDLRVVSDRRELFVRTLQALGATSLIVAVLYYWFPVLILGRGVFMIAAVLVIAITIGWRMTFEWATKHTKPRERLLIVGTNEAALRLARELHDRRTELGVMIVGFVDTDPGQDSRRSGRAGHHWRRRRHPVARRGARRGPRRGQSDRRPRQVVDEQAARHAHGWRVVRATAVGLRAVHGEDRRRQPPAELAHLLRRVRQGLRVWQASSG